MTDDSNSEESVKKARRSPGETRRSASDTLHSSALPESVECPFCGGMETEQFAAFGGQASTSQYYCRPCRSVFEYLRWR